MRSAAFESSLSYSDISASSSPGVGCFLADAADKSGGCGKGVLEPGGVYSRGMVRAASMKACMRRLSARWVGSTEVEGRYENLPGGTVGDGGFPSASGVSERTAGKCLLSSAVASSILPVRIRVRMSGGGSAYATNEWQGIARLCGARP